MYKRWIEFCKVNLSVRQLIDEPGITGRGARPVPALPRHLAQQFINANIEWAKIKVTARINRLMWGRSPNDTAGTSSVEAVIDDDDEYDPTVDW
jgi:hypothetical protein